MPSTQSGRRTQPANGTTSVTGDPAGRNRTLKIPLDRLEAADGNVRRAPVAESDENELRGSIRAHGLLENLIVLQKTRGRNPRYGVIGGRRRYRALRWLADEKEIPQNAPVACTLVETDEPTEIGLAENAVRVQMHDADLIDAFAHLVETGRPITEIANRFGMPVRRVEQMLRLQGVHPDIRQAHRDNHVPTEVLESYALTTDANRQLHIWSQIGGAEAGADMHARARVRAALTSGALPGNDRLVQFVGIDNYRKAGGALLEDLFTQSGEPGMLLLGDGALVRQLAADLLQEKVTELAGEWEWVEGQIEQGWSLRYGFGKAAADTPGVRTADEQRRLEEIDDERSRLSARIDESTGLDASAETDGMALNDLHVALGELNNEEARIMDAVEQRSAWSERIRKVTGCVLSIDDDGRVEQTGGLIRKEDIERVDRILNPPAEPPAAPTETAAQTVPQTTEDPGAEPAEAPGRPDGDQQAAPAGPPADTAEATPPTPAEAAAPEQVPEPSAAADTPPAEPAPPSEPAAAPENDTAPPRVQIDPPVDHQWEEAHPGESSEPASRPNPWTAACQQVGYTTGLGNDIRTARRAIVADALRGDAGVAQLLATFQLAEQAVSAIRQRGDEWAGSRVARPEEMPLGINMDRAQQGAVLQQKEAAELLGPWSEPATAVERFEALGAYKPSRLAAVMAEAVAALVRGQTSFEPDRSLVLERAVGMIRPRWRQHWGPRDQDFLGRMRRDDLLALGERFGGPEWAHAQRSSTRSDIAEAVGKLFDESAAGTLDWTPPGFEPREEDLTTPGTVRETDGEDDAPAPSDSIKVVPAFLEDGEPQENAEA